jgi:hypothetical protein
LLSDEGLLEPVAYGCRGDRESWSEWVVYSKAEVSAYNAVFGEHDWRSLTGWDYYYSGPGQAYGHAPFATESRTRILVRQDGGLDI